MKKTTRVIFSLQLLANIVTFHSVKPLQISITTNTSDHLTARISGGSDVILNCSTVRQEQIKEVKWLKDNHIIAEDQIDTKRDGTGLVLFSTLNLLKVSAKNTNGLYQCLSWKQNSSDVSTSYELHVDEPPAVRTTVRFTYFNASEPIHLNCIYTAGWPKPSVHWKALDGKDINKSSFTISNKKPGKYMYTCVAVNRVGEAKESRNIAVPKLIHNGQVTGHFNSSVSLIVHVKGAQLPVISTAVKWLFNGKPLPDDKPRYKEEPNLKEGTFRLTIKDLVAEDVGKYAVSIIYPQARLVGFITLHVEDLPVGPVALSTSPTANYSSHIPTDSPSISVQIIDSSMPKTIWPVAFLIIALLCLLAFVSFHVFTRLVKRKKYGFFKETKNEKQEPKFDVFISYTKSDFDWVSKELLPLLDKHLVTYCIHCKDFEVGKTIVDNMADSVYLSKHVIVVLSDRYTASAFCRSELDMAIYRSKLIKKPALTVINLGCSSIKKLTKMNKKTFHLYSVGNSKRDVWRDEMMKQLESSLYEPQTV